MKILITLCLLFTLTSCALAPFSANTSGRSYGAGTMQMEVGNSNSNYHIKFGYGLSTNFDIGYVMEFGNMTTSAIFMKYSFINNDVGPSFATEFGYGSTESTTFSYLGGIGSLAFTKEFELFINPRVNIVETAETDIELNESIGNLTVTDYDVNYLQVNYGFNVWFTESFGMTLYSIWFKGNDIETNESNTIGASFLVKL